MEISPHPAPISLLRHLENAYKTSVSVYIMFANNLNDLHNVIQVINICNNFYFFFEKCCRFFAFVQLDQGTKYSV